jgi:hypothetical protein
MLTPLPPGTRSLRQIFLLGVTLFAIMFVAAAALYGVTGGLLWIKDYYVGHQVTADSTKSVKQ